MSRKLESLDYDMKRQFFELQALMQKSGGNSQQQGQDLLEKRIQKLNGDSEGYYRTIQQLRGQIEEISRVHKLIQAQTATPSSQALVNRLEGKITGLQAHIEDLESQIKRKQLNYQPQVQSQVQPQVQPQSPSRGASKANWQRASMFAEPTNTFVQQQQQPQSMKLDIFDIEIDQGYRPNSSRLFNERPGQTNYNDSMKYHGDPKVKTIIDEFNQKKRQIQASTTGTPIIFSLILN